LEEANAFDLEGDIQSNQGDFEAALDAYRLARSAYRQAGSLLGERTAYASEADALVRLERYEEAISSYRQSRALFAGPEDPLGQGNCWRGEAEALRLSGRYREALAVYPKARAQFSAAGDELDMGDTYRGEAQARLEFQEWRTAIRDANQALKLMKPYDADRGKSLALVTRAFAQEGTKQLAAAVASAKEAIRRHSNWRDASVEEAHRAFSDLDIVGAYEVLIEILARQPGRSAEALNWAEKARSRAMLDLLAAGPSAAPHRSIESIQSEQKRIETALADVEGKPNEKGERRRLDRRLEWNRYQILATQAGILRSAEPLDSKRIQALARRTGPILLYYSGDSKLWAFLVRPGFSRIRVKEIDLGWHQLHTRAHELAYDLANPLHEAKASRLGHELYDVLIAPLARWLPASGPLVIIPHGPLHEVAFEALLDPADVSLSSRWDLSYSPSVSALAFARHRHHEARPADSFVAFSSGHGLSLPDSEVAEIARFFGKNQATFRSTAADLKSYEQLAPRARQLLIASRGVHTEGSRTETYLEILRTENVHDGRLTAAEIAAIPLQTELVTLAACDTSHGEVPYSDERLTLTRSFLVAGAAAVLATRWKVPEDLATSHLLSDFFRFYRYGDHGQKRLRKDTALAAARRLSRERGDPAQVWAPWVLIGDSR
ncbi:MAG TPA: CHAT domain-containing protein, partial [Thermoanaerobaculia bacterium]|nr:CHAT domain-containing protein [Thermoanaerobaculia bacterium]